MSSIFWNRAAETLAPGDYRELHFRKLRRQLDYVAQRSVFYQQKFAEREVQPSPLRALDDLSRFRSQKKANFATARLKNLPLGRIGRARPRQ